MTRRLLWFLGLGSQARAQAPSSVTLDGLPRGCQLTPSKIVVCPDSPGVGFNENTPWIPKPLNGQCARCGTMAPKYVRRQTSYELGRFDPQWLKDEKLDDVRSFSSEGTYQPWMPNKKYVPMIVTWGGKTRLHACDYCRTVFEQTAEDVKQ